MVNLVRRPLGDHLVRQGSAPVLIVEGARAVGKTTMVRDQLANERGYYYTSLADIDTRRLASADLAGWLARLPRPAIIDEAQLIGELPLAVKEYVDRSSGGIEFILTGSASIGRAGLDGADPLTRRSQRFTMHPLTRWEIRAQPGALVDSLFDGEPVPGTYIQIGDSELLNILRVGGFPGFVYPRTVMTRAQLSTRIANDITGLLSDEVVADTNISTGKARALLNLFLRNPGGILNVSAVASQAELNKRTVESYLAHFGRLFILQWLQNLAVPPRKQDFARAKVHPVDTAFAVDALERGGVDILASREVFGQLLESHVVAELLAGAQWAANSTRAFYWRIASSTSPEVDLVLIDDKDRAIAVEVKAATRVSLDDIRGIRAFGQSRPLHRGFILYRGNEVRQMTDNIWALPFSVLESADTFRAESEEGAVEKASEAVVMTSSDTSAIPNGDGALFLSYVHADDTSLHGRITRFAHDLVDRYALLYGHELQLFIDRDDINWGESWRERLARELGATTFLVSAVTPRYLKSESCRKEVLDFATATDNSTKLLLPLLWAGIDGTDVVPESDPVLRRIRDSQWIDVQAARRLEPGTAVYDELLELVAVRLKKTIDARSSTAVSAPGLHEEGSDEVGGLVDLFATMPELQGRFEEAADDFKSSLEAIGEALNEQPFPQEVGPAAVTAFRRLGARVAAPSARLENATNKLGAAWHSLEQLIEKYVQLSADAPDVLGHSAEELVEGLDRSLEIPGLEEFEQMTVLFGNFSKDLRPMSRSLSASIRLIRGIQNAARGWRERLESLE